MLETIVTLAQLFAEDGKQLYMVGGTVRDMLLHRATTGDVDLTTDARPDEIKRLVAATHPVAVVSVGEQFGTIRLHYPRAVAEGAPSHAPATAAAVESPEPAALVVDHAPDVDVIEITTFRSDVYNSTSRKPEVAFGDNLVDDLLRRDFTINAMARDPLTGAIFDPYGGRADLERGLIRAVGDDPEHRFDEDPLRMLRAARFAAQLDFDIEQRTAVAIHRQAATLDRISRERVRDELTKLLVTSDPGRGLRQLVDPGRNAVCGAGSARVARRESAH